MVNAAIAKRQSMTNSNADAVGGAPTIGSGSNSGVNSEDQNALPLGSFPANVPLFGMPSVMDLPPLPPLPGFLQHPPMYRELIPPAAGDLAGFQRSRVFSSLPPGTSKKKDTSSDDFMVTDLHA